MPLFAVPHAVQPDQLDLSSSFASIYNNVDVLGSAGAYGAHPSFLYLALLVFEAVLEVVCISLPGYVIAKMGMFDAEAQKFVANLNVILFTPCLIFTKLASKLTADKLLDLAIIPFIFAAQTGVSYLSAALVSRCFGFRKRQASFVTAMGVFGNSNSLPISLVISLSKTISGLHWDRIPNDNDGEVAARGILYLLIFQQLGQLLRWSWGYRVLLAPREQFYRDEEERANERIGSAHEPYADNPAEHSTPASTTGHLTASPSSSSVDAMAFSSGAQTPVETHDTPSKPTSRSEPNHENGADGPLLALPDGSFAPRQLSQGNIFRFPDVEDGQELDKPTGFKGWARRSHARTRAWLCSTSRRCFASLPAPVRRSSRRVGSITKRFALGVWEFMNPPLWAMLVAIIVASIPSLQHLFFTKGTFLSNSVTRAVEQSGGVAVPLILVVLGANLERGTLEQGGIHDPAEEDAGEGKLVAASLISRMVLPTVVMGPVLALVAKFVPISILDDPIFVVVCFLLTGSPSALQLAQICQLNNVFVGAMSRLLFQSYVIWILPSTLILVLCALKVVEWATM